MLDSINREFSQGNSSNTVIFKIAVFRDVVVVS